MSQDSVDTFVRHPSDRASIPGQQTLERLACTALCAAYPGRGRNVHDFIAARVSPPTGHVHKALAMSHMAGWYADKDFYQHLWQVDATRAILLQLLAQQPAWPQIAALAS